MNECAVLFINYLMEFIERILVLLPISNRMKNKNIMLRILFVAIFSPLVNTTIEIYVTDFVALYVLQIILVILEIGIIFGFSLPDTIVQFCLQDIIIAIIQFPIAYLIENGIKGVAECYIGIIGNALTIIVITIVFSLIDVKYYLNVISSNRLSFNLILMNMVILFEIENIIFKNYKADYHEYRILLLVCVIVIVLLNYIVINNERRVIVAQSERELYKRDVEVMHALMEELRTRQHQYDNRFQTISGLPYIHKDYESLKNALTEYNAYIKDDYDVIEVLQLNYHLVGAFLFSKLKYARTQSKPLHITIKNVVLNTKAKEPDIVEILGVLMDNMIEASDNKGKCELILDSYDNHLEIVTINKGPKLTSDIQNNLFKRGYSTKTNTGNSQRGYGLYALSEIVKKYDGRVYVDNEYSPDGNTTYITFKIVI